jgi:glycerol-1-phosphatase
VAIADPYGSVALDIDGVLVRGHTAVPGAVDALDALRDRGKGVVLVTNNASRTPREIADWLGAAGFSVAAEEVVTSAHASARLLEPGTRCLVIGMAGLREALTDRGCRIEDDPAAAQAVVVGFDRTVCWDDLQRATAAIVGGARFVGTNADPSLPVEGGIWPGNGAILAALETASGRRPEIAGKPHRPLFEAAAERLGDGPVLVVGDRVDTDIEGAAAIGWDAALVLTGVTDQATASRARPAPRFVVDSVADLLA